MKMQLAKGVKDVPPEEKIIKDQVIELITKKFQKYGFSPLETPIIERYETLAAKFGAGAGSDALKETFTFTDQGKRKLGLRFELTTSLARFIAQNPTLKFPFKRYEVGRNFRDGPIKLGRTREFWQYDADTVGTDSMLAEAEQIAILAEVFRELKFEFVIKVNNRKVLNGILNQAGIKKQKEALIALDKLDKIGNSGVQKELLEKGYTKEQAKTVLALISGDVTLKQMEQKITNAEGKEGLEELGELFSFLKGLGVTEAKYDVALARGQAYYTGTVLEVFFTKSVSGVTSSIGGGGRYDDMIGGFLGGGRRVPAVGVSFGLEPIMCELREREKLEKKTLSQVYIIPLNTENEALVLSQKLRAAGINTSLALGKKGVTKNLQYAAALGIPYVLILGAEELKKNKILLRDMDTGEETLLTLQQVVKKLQ